MFRLFRKNVKRKQRIRNIKYGGCDAEKIRKDNHELQVAKLRWERGEQVWRNERFKDLASFSESAERLGQRGLSLGARRSI